MVCVWAWCERWGSGTPCIRHSFALLLSHSNGFSTCAISGLWLVSRGFCVLAMFVCWRQRRNCMCISCYMLKVNCRIKRQWQHGKWGAQSCGLPVAHRHMAVWTRSWWSVALPGHAFFRRMATQHGNFGHQSSMKVVWICPEWWAEQPCLLGLFKHMRKEEVRVRLRIIVLFNLGAPFTVSYISCPLFHPINCMSIPFYQLKGLKIQYFVCGLRTICNTK